MPLTEDHVREELKKVIDPELLCQHCRSRLDLPRSTLNRTANSPPKCPTPPKHRSRRILRPKVSRLSASRVAKPKRRPPRSQKSHRRESTSDDNSDKLDVFIEMTMTSPMCPAGPQLIAQSKAVVSAIDEVADVEVKIVLDPPWTPDKMTEDARDQLGIF